MEYNILSFEINAKETKGFKLSRPSGKGSYVFLRFRSPVFVKDKTTFAYQQPNSCILYAPADHQSFSSPDCDFIHDYITFDIQKKDFFEYINFPINTMLYPKEISMVDDILSLIKNEQGFPAPAQREMIDILITKLFILLSREYSSANLLPDVDILPKETFISLRNDLYNNPQNYTVAVMAQKLHFSVTYFSAKYKLIFKTTPKDDITKAKLEMAIKLLQNKKTPIEVANHLNFDSLSNFYKWFKKNTGYTPKTFYKNTVSYGTKKIETI